MAKDPPESNESSLVSPSDGSEDSDREDSGFQDILAVAAKIKDTPDEDEGDDMSSEDSGMIVFSAGDFGSGNAAEGDDDGLFGEFGGSLGAGFGASTDPLDSSDVAPLGGEGSVRETMPAEVRPKPGEEQKRNPLMVFAVVVGLALVGAGAVYLTHDPNDAAEDQQAQAEMSANPNDEAAVGMAEPIAEDEANSNGGAGLGEGQAPGEVEPEAMPLEGEGETEGAMLTGETEGAALGDADDPMAQKDGLLEADGTKKVAKAGKWDQGHSAPKPSGGGSSSPAPEPDPDPTPVAAPEPDPVPAKKPAGGGGNDDEVDCLLNPDLAKCQGGGTTKPKEDEVLAPKLPDKLSSTQLRAGFNSVKSKAKACGSKFGAAAGTKVKVHASIEGSSGKVSSVSATGEHAGTDLGKCVEGVVKGATFEQFKKPAMGIDYSLIM